MRRIQEMWSYVRHNIQEFKRCRHNSSEYDLFMNLLAVKKQSSISNLLEVLNQKLNHFLFRRCLPVLRDLQISTQCRKQTR